MIKYCECRCGQEVKNKFVRGHNLKTDEIRKNNSIRMNGKKYKLGYKLTKKQRENISKGRLIRKEKLGYTNSLETRKKIRKGVLKAYGEGRLIPTKGKKNGMYGKKRTEKARKITSIKNKEKWKDLNSKFHKRDLRGEKNGAWMNGISFEPYGIEFNKELKETIREKNNYRCQQCFRHQDELYYKNGKRYNLIIHHIDYNKKNNSPENLISLCRNCHAQTNFKRDDWINYFEKRISGVI